MSMAYSLSCMTPPIFKDVVTISQVKLTKPTGQADLRHRVWASLEQAHRSLTRFDEPAPMMSPSNGGDKPKGHPKESKIAWGGSHVGSAERCSMSVSRFIVKRHTDGPLRRSIRELYVTISIHFFQIKVVLLFKWDSAENIRASATPKHGVLLAEPCPMRSWQRPWCSGCFQKRGWNGKVMDITNPQYCIYSVIIIYIVLVYACMYLSIYVCIYI